MFPGRPILVLLLALGALPGCAAPPDAEGPFGIGRTGDGEQARSAAAAPVAPEPGDLVITEIMPSPAAVADVNGEWFEVTNVADHSLVVSGLQLPARGYGEYTEFRPLVVAAGEALLVASDPHLGANGGLRPDLSAGVTHLELDNGSDSVTLLLDGVVIDSVSYDASWPFDYGWSMSLAPESADVDANDDAAAWCLGTAVYGAGDHGTPGEVNDACAPDEDGDGSTSAFDCDDGDATVYPGADDPPGDGIDQDCDGADAVAPTLTIADLVRGDLLVTEAMTRGDNEHVAEWFELHNQLGEAVDLTGLTISGDSDFVIDGLTIPANGYVVIGGNDDARTNGGFDFDYVPAGGLRHYGDGGRIEVIAGKSWIDVVIWTRMDWRVRSGASLSLDPTKMGPGLNNNPHNWCTATAEYNVNYRGTPGEENEPC